MEKTVILKLVVSGFGEASQDLSFLTTETAKLNVAKAKLSTESRNAAKVLESEVGSMEHLRAQTALLRQEENKLGDTTDKSGQKRKELSARISDNTVKIRDHDRAISGSSTLIGEYERGFSGAFKNIGSSLASAGLQLISFAAVAGLAAKAIGEIKEAFFSTDEGIGVLKKWSEAAKTFFYGITHTSNKGDILTAVNAAEEINRLRIADRQDALMVVRLETEINVLRFKSVDATKSQSYQLENLNKLQKKENELIAFKKADLIEEIRAYETLWMTQKNNSTLNDIINAKRVELERLDGDRSFRIESRKSGLIAKGVKDQEDANKKIIEGQKALQTEVDKYNTSRSESNTKAVDEFIKKAEEESEKMWDFGMNFSKLLFNQNKKQAEKEWDALLKRNEDEIKEEEKKQKQISEVKRAAVEGIQQGADSVFIAKKNRLQADMEAELSNMNLTEKQKLAIKKKYAREQQQIDIKQAIINGALAVAKIFAEVTPLNPLSWLAVGIVAVQTAIQVAVIKAQKFASGGRIVGGMRVTPDSRGDDTLVIARQGEAIINESQQRSIGTPALRRAGIPGFASGGLVGGVSYSPGLPFDMEAIMDKVVRAFNDKEVTLNLNKLNTAQKTLDLIVQTSGI